MAEAKGALLHFPAALAAPADARPGPPAAPSEEAVLAGALAGDGGCWARLVARHDRTVVVSLLARGVALDRAREIAQETWLRLIESQRAGKLDRLVLPGLAIVQAGFLLASEQRQPRLPISTEDRAGAPSPEESAAQRQRLDRVARALAGCPPSARRVFELVYAHPELTYEQLAPQVGLSAQRTKQIVCEVRKRLRAALDEPAPRKEEAE